MDNTLSFDEGNKKPSRTDWQFGVQSDVSLGAGPSRLSFQQNLHVLPTKEIKSKKPLIPATLAQKLSYFSMYACSVGKLEIMCKQQNNVNRFFWLYISNVLCKSLPMTYVYLFLSAYAPDYHLYISKMVPLCYGCNWMFVISGIFQLLVMLNASSLYFVYFIMGIVDKVPWKRCVSQKSIVFEWMYNCYNLAEFSTKFNNADITYEAFFYSTPEENFTLAQIQYFDSVVGYVETNMRLPLLIITTFVIIFAVLGYRQLYKELIWKVLFYSHMALCTFMFGIFLHLVLTYEKKTIQNILSTDKKASDFLMNADFDILAESMTAPPVVHVINSRSFSQIQPSFGSGIIATSNAAMYILKALTSYLMVKHCERWVNGPIIHWHYDKYSAFYMWPIYFATIYFGDFLILIFFALNAVVDICLCLITFHCIVVTIRSEWKWIRPWCIIVVVLIAVIFDRFSGSVMVAEICFITWTGVSTLVEAVTICWMYPLSRFVDDITFHCGTPPTKLRVLSFRILPIFYLIKMYVMFSRLLKYKDISGQIYIFVNDPEFTFVYQCALFLLGIMISIYKYVYKQKKNWAQLFKPLPEWGPKDFNSRHLRKQFNSNEFIASQAPRDLSRHLINKAELRSYKVDVRYNNSRRTTWTKTNDEKVA